MTASAEALQEALEILFQIAEGNTTSNSRDREEGVKTSERRAERDGKSNGINERTRIQHDDDNRIEMERKEGESKQQKWTLGDAQCFVGQMHEDGMGIPCNEKEAARMYHLAVDNEHSVTQCMLGYFYDTGSLGLTKDLRKAFDLYHLAAAKINYVAQYNLSLMYQVIFPPPLNNHFRFSFSFFRFLFLVLVLFMISWARRSINRMTRRHWSISPSQPARDMHALSIRSG